MAPGQALERLLAHQDEVLGIIRATEAMLANDARDVPGLARSRWELVRALTAYQMFKHREIFDPMLARAAPVQAQRLIKMKRACTDIGELFRVHVQTWSAADVAGRWAEFRPAARTMIARIRAHMAAEKANVADLLSEV